MNAMAAAKESIRRGGRDEVSGGGRGGRGGGGFSFGSGGNVELVTDDQIQGDKAGPPESTTDVFWSK